MSDHESKKSKEVFIESDDRSWRFGEGPYLKTWNGFKFTLNTEVIKTLAFPIALGLAIFVFFGKKELNHKGEEIKTPEMFQSLPILTPKILIDQDLARQSKVPVVASPLGGIQVLNLRSLSNIPPGSEVKAVLESGASNGVVKAKLILPLLVEGEPVLPEGVIALGVGKSTEERLYVEFKKIIFRSGESYPIHAQAFDPSDKILGLKGSLVGSKTKKRLLGLGFGVTGGMLDALQDTSGSLFGLERKPTLRNVTLAGGSQAALSQSQSYYDDARTLEEMIEVKQGTEFYLIVTDITAEK